MLENQKDVFDQIKEELKGYTISDRDDYSDALHQICDGMIDIATYDLFESIWFLYNEGLLEEVYGDLIYAVQSAQYEYFSQVAYDFDEDLWASVKVADDDDDDDDDIIYNAT
jgi:hypothetical protein